MIVVANAAIKKAFDQAEYRVSVEDFLPEMLRRDLPDGIGVYTRQPEGVKFPFVLVAAAPSNYGYSPVRPGMDVIGGEISVFTDGIDAESDGFRLAWAVWDLIEGYYMDNAPTPDGVSFVRWARLVTRPKRRPDWAEAVGPVQYQDLPQGHERYKMNVALTLHHFRPQVGAVG